MSRQVFISYARRDLTRVEPLVAALKLAATVWWDRELEPGEPWRRILLQQLSTIDAVVVCWTPAAAASDYVSAEARIALDRALLIPVKLEPCRPPPPFGQLQTLDLTQWRGGAEGSTFARLVTAIERNFHERQARDRLLAVEHRLRTLLGRLDTDRVRRDAEAGVSAAQSLLGHALVLGTKVLPRDLSTGMHWLECAARQGIADAAATLGTAYMLLADPADWPAAVYWLEHAAGLGHADASRELANIFASGYEGVERNLTLAAHYAALADSSLDAMKSG